MRNILWLGGAIAVTIPGLYLRISGSHPGPEFESVLFGLAILGAAFLLSWGCETAQVEISQALAIALLALVAVLPEYAVDLYFAWTAGHDPSYAPYAVANMTGANRLLIGVGWALVPLVVWLRTRRRGVEFPKGQTNEMAFLMAATVYAFIIPLKGNLSLIDTVVLGTLFILYIWSSSRAESKEPELFGPCVYIVGLPKLARRLVTVFLFLFPCAVILASAEPFAEGLIQTGKQLAIDEFVLVQWVAPLASEAPEIIVAALFASRGNGLVALSILISSKVNQWTLLVGTLPLVYSISSGSIWGLPLDSRQVEEVLLTAAQSFFALALLARFRLSNKGGLVLLLLFLTQLAFPNPVIRYGYSAFYAAAALLWFLVDRQRLANFYFMMKGAIASLRTPRS